MKEYLERFPSVTVLVVGDVMLDLYLSGTVERVSPEAPVPILHVEDRRAVLGGAANVAANVKSLGAKVYLAGLVGDDPEGRELASALENTGIATDCLLTSAERPTTVKTRLIAQHHQLARYDTEARHAPGAAQSSELSESIDRVLSECDAVIVSDYAKGVLSRDFTARLITKCNDGFKPVFVDPKGTDFLKYASAAVLTPNEKEAREAAEFAGFTGSDIETSGELLRRHLRLPSLLVTRGEKGMLLFEENAEPYPVEALERNVFDVTGAGDTVISTLALCRAAGADFRTSAFIANIAAGRVVEKLGTAAVDLEELAAELEGLSS